MRRPLISVMIGVYNAERYLAEAIESVFAQAYRPLELIVIDDGSDDGSSEVARRFGDALTYARRLGCTHLVDAATLTGAIVVALGHVNIGAFATDENLVEKVLRSAGAEGEKMWRMPLDEEYKELLKSAFADMHNIGGRHGGAITAAMFLREFADTTPWVHLDIAGTAWLDDPKPFLSKGPSGVGVRTLVNLAMNW